MDLILIEGLKFSAWLKLEVVRSDNSSGPVCDPATLLAFVTDLPIEYFGVKMILSAMQKRPPDIAEIYGGRNFLLIDQFGRNINYLRISVTDKCNLRCGYCIPPGQTGLLLPENILTNRQLLRLVSLFAEAGIIGLG